MAALTFRFVQLGEREGGSLFICVCEQLAESSANSKSNEQESQAEHSQLLYHLMS